ncbi:MAG: electron transport complex subunit RsxC [Pseudomonadota bacterium]
MSSAATENLYKLPGGIRLPGFKAQSATGEVHEVAVPAELIISLRQHAGTAALPRVGVGDHVFKGQVVARADGQFSANVHASSSGTVTAIEPRPVPGRAADSAPCIVIATDGKDQALDTLAPITNPFAESAESLLEAIGEAGIVGLGGAAFPTLPKMRQAIGSDIDTLILNGVECEPYISCDDALMRTAATDILYGARIMIKALGLTQCFVGIESDKPEAWNAFVEAAQIDGDDRLHPVMIPTVYPSGGEDQLVYLMTGREVPSQGFPSDRGVLVHNVGTAAAVAEFALTGMPMISRIVTVTGDGIAQPGNYRVRFGTPISDVAGAAGGYTERAKRLIMGGPMTGVSLTNDAMPVTKACNCLLITGPAIQTSKEPERPCIRCGECARICPVRLQPQQLHRSFISDDGEQLEALGLVDCIECGCCDLVCPSHIPLTQSFREAKQRRRMEVYERERAERARERFETRQQRDADREQQSAAAIQQIKDRANRDSIAQILARKQSSSAADDKDKDD